MLYMYLGEWNPRVWDMSGVYNSMYPTSPHLKLKGALVYMPPKALGRRGAEKSSKRSDRPVFGSVVVRASPTFAAQCDSQPRATSADGSTVEAQWQHSGSTVAAQWQHSDSTVAAQWQHSAGQRNTPHTSTEHGTLASSSTSVPTGSAVTVTVAVQRSAAQCGTGFTSTELRRLASSSMSATTAST
eukprot:7740235-Pyramimonas_sp.AAC.1